MGADVGKAGLDLGDAIRVGRGLGLSISSVRSLGALSTTSSRLSRPVGRFLGEAANAPARRNVDRAAFSPSSPVMTLNSVDLPVPLRPTRPTRAPGAMRAEASSRASGRRSGP